VCPKTKLDAGNCFVVVSIAEGKTMERFYIVKEAPGPGSTTGSSICKGTNNRCYTYEEAADRARELASNNRLTYVVMRAECAFGPVSDVMEIAIR
jgi:hypothetical protein